MMNNAKLLSVLLALLVGSSGFVHGQDNSDKHPSTEVFSGGLGLVSMFLIVLFCMCGTYLCVSFTCCHEYMCEPEENSGCGYRKSADEELNPKNSDGGEVGDDSPHCSLQITERSARLDPDP